MAEEPPPGVDLDQVAEIVGSYVRHHQIAPEGLAGLIVEVYRALAGLGPAEKALSQKSDHRSRHRATATGRLT